VYGHVSVEEALRAAERCGNPIGDVNHASNFRSAVWWRSAIVEHGSHDDFLARSGHLVQNQLKESPSEYLVSW